MSYFCTVHRYHWHGERARSLLGRKIKNPWRLGAEIKFETKKLKYLAPFGREYKTYTKKGKNSLKMR